MEHGKLPNLLRLKVDYVDMKPGEASALARGLSSGAFQRLQEFDVSQNTRIGDPAMAEVVSALAGGKCQDLRSLLATDTGREVVDIEPRSLCYILVSSDYEGELDDEERFCKSNYRTLLST